MRGDGFVTRRTSLVLGVSLAVLGSATMASAQGMPLPPPPPTAASPGQPLLPAPAQPSAAQPPTAVPPAPPAPLGAPPPQPSPQASSPSVPPAYPPAVMYGPSRLPYNDDDPIPPGYEIQTRPRMGMAKAGIATFAPLYGLSVLFGGVYLGSQSGDAGKYGPMLLPVIGPWVTIGTADTDEGTFFLVLDGLGQATGAALFLAGMLTDEKYLARTTGRLNLRPEVFVSPTSVAMRWQF